MGGAKSEINLGMLLARRLQVLGSTLRARPVEEKAALVRDFLARFGSSLASGEIGPVVDRTLDLADAKEVDSRMRQGIPSCGCGAMLVGFASGNRLLPETRRHLYSRRIVGHRRLGAR